MGSRPILYRRMAVFEQDSEGNNPVTTQTSNVKYYYQSNSGGQVGRTELKSLLEEVL